MGALNDSQLGELEVTLNCFDDLIQYAKGKWPAVAAPSHRQYSRSKAGKVEDELVRLLLRQLPAGPPGVCLKLIPSKLLI